MHPDDGSTNTPAALSTEAERNDTDLTDTERRAALAKLGALAAWTAPVMLTLMAAPRRSAASFGTEPNTP